MVKIAEATPELPRQPYLPQIAHRLPFEHQAPFPHRIGAISPYYGHPRGGYTPPCQIVKRINIIPHVSRMWLWVN